MTKRNLTLGRLYRPLKIRYHKWMDTISDYKRRLVLGLVADNLIQTTGRLEFEVGLIIVVLQESI